MGVVSYCRSERACFELEPADESHTDIAGGAVALDHDQLQNIALDVGHNSASFSARRFDALMRDNLVRHDFDNTDFSGVLGKDFKVVWRLIAHVHRATRRRHWCGRCGQIFSVLGDQNPLLVSLAHGEILQVIKHYKVGPVPRRDGSVVAQSIVTSGVDGGDLERCQGRHAKSDRGPHAMINMSLIYEIARQFVICGERTVHRIVRVY